MNHIVKNAFENLWGSLLESAEIAVATTFLGICLFVSATGLF